MPQAQLLIVNEKGLHARAASCFAKTASRFKSHVTVSYNDYSASGQSIMGLMMLTAAKGANITIKAEGDDAEQALEALSELVSCGFHE